MRGKEGNSTTPTKFLPLHFVKLAALASLVKDKIKSCIVKVLLITFTTKENNNRA